MIQYYAVKGTTFTFLSNLTLDRCLSWLSPPFWAVANGNRILLTSYTPEKGQYLVTTDLANLNQVSEHVDLISGPDYYTMYPAGIFDGEVVFGWFSSLYGMELYITDTQTKSARFFGVRLCLVFPHCLKCNAYHWGG